MFGITLPKILFTLLAVAVVWYGFRYLNRVTSQGDQGQTRVRGGTAARRRGAAASRRTDVEDMVRCDACGEYVPAAGARSCGRKECPFPG